MAISGTDRTIDSSLNPIVKTAKVYIINGKLSQEEIAKKLE